MRALVVRGVVAATALGLSAAALLWLEAIASVDWQACLDQIGTPLPRPPTAPGPFDATVRDALAARLATSGLAGPALFALPFVAPALAFAASRVPGRRRAVLALWAGLFVLFAWAFLPPDRSHDCDRKGVEGGFVLFALAPLSLILTPLALFAVPAPRRSRPPG